MTLAELKLELQKRCIDLGQIKRPDTRYGELLNNAVSHYPLELWQTDIDEGILTADQREYSLTDFPTITSAAQVRRVWVDDEDDIPHEIGRWEVLDDEGDLTLIIEEPPDESRGLTIEYHKQPSATTDCDDEWLLACALVGLWGEADWSVDDPQQAMAQIEYWNGRMAARERQLLHQRRRSSRRARTTAWRQYVT